MSHRAIGSRVHAWENQTAPTCATTKALSEVTAVDSVVVVSAPDIADLSILITQALIHRRVSLLSYLIFRTVLWSTVHECVLGVLCVSYFNVMLNQLMALSLWLIIIKIYVLITKLFPFENYLTQYFMSHLKENYDGIKKNEHQSKECIFFFLHWRVCLRWHGLFSTSRAVSIVLPKIKHLQRDWIVNIL